MKQVLYALFLGVILLLCTPRPLYAQPVYQPQKTEFRGVWIATVGNIDWPSKKGLSVDEQKAEFIRLVDYAQSLKLNAIVVQIRPTGDAFYRSALNPWTEFLTGTEGKDPGYDPLAFMITEAHKRNLEFHAWFNPFRVSNNASAKKEWAPNSMVKAHPDWVVDYDNKKYLNPGLPQVRQYVLASILEVVQNYDIDAIHFDDYFYPYPTNVDFPDQKTFTTDPRGFKNKSDWRRDNINLFMQSVYEQVKTANDEVKVGVSPFGIWRNMSQDPEGSKTTSTVSSYDSLNADTRLWVRNGWVDYIAPQIYWEFANKYAPYNQLVNYWGKEMANHPNVQLYIGQAPYKLGTTPNSWKNKDEIQAQLAYNQYFSEVRGSIFYNMSSILKNPVGFSDAMKNQYYQYPALVPPMQSASTVPVAPVTIKKADVGKNGISLTLEGIDENASAFVIYRSEGGQVPDIENPKYIVGIVQKDALQNNLYVDRALDVPLGNGNRYTYYVTALDRLHNESPVSNAVTVFK